MRPCQFAFFACCLLVTIGALLAACGPSVPPLEIVSTGIPDCDRLIQAMAKCVDSSDASGLDRRQARDAVNTAITSTANRIKRITDKGVVSQACQEDLASNNGTYQCSFIFKAIKAPPPAKAP